MKLKQTVLCLAILLSTCLLIGSLAGAAELKFNTEDFAPFNYEVGGVVAGPAADIIRKVCSDIKIACSLNLLP